ncbi:hypothetical protein DPMN_118097 [Dreissena polymorpha]|uniref:Germinal-center associated nuclear protein n=1 Tax=Dreissena polymorpha TaxID=45954 RepID=A0A9D4GG48_DREPO|nr:hypothetical protein DPMN_118097 [Dreissena polymorpha]
MSNPFNSASQGSFGMDSNGTSQSVFGQQVGLTQTGVFGQSPGGSGLFGSNFPANTSRQTEPFGQQMLSFTSAIPQNSSNSLFGQAPTPSSSSLFSTSTQVLQSSSSPNVFGGSSSVGLFGQNPQSSLSAPSQLGPVSTSISGSSTSMFGTSFPSTAANSVRYPSPPLFGASLFNKQADVSSSKDSLPSYAAAISAIGSSFNSTQTAQSSDGRSSAFVVPKQEGASMFGKPATGFGQSASVSINSANTSSVLFGGSKSETYANKNEGLGLFTQGAGDTKPFQSKSDSGLFGKRSLPRYEEAPKMLFGKKVGQNVDGSNSVPENQQLVKQEGMGIKSESHASKENWYGKPKEKATHYAPEKQSEPERLFGKAIKAFGKEDEDEDYNESASNDEGGESKPIAARGLFGKNTAATAGSTVSPSGLFGKGKIQRNRIPSSSDANDRNGRPSLRRQMSDDINNKVAIICRNVPAKFNSVYSLRSHFKKFGDVSKVFPNQSKMQATIHFRTHEAAAEAKRKGRLLGRGIPPMTIFWSNFVSAVGRGSDSEEKPTRTQKRRSDESEAPVAKRGPAWKSNEVSDELEAMAGTGDIREAADEVPRGLKFEPQEGRVRVKPQRRSPERSVSPVPTTSASDVKIVSVGMFEGVGSRTTTDRVQLLELRDKYVRQNRGKKQTDIHKAKAFVGTCPDMCPEKERYNREDKRCLSVYEIVPGTENIPGRNPQVDHQRAVKEFVRSSPDQDEPLPHELRPMPVLLYTMTYLLSDIANRGQDGRWGDWFDFLWNRTRGIRKDIIQQQLNDRNAVQLIERCARFHIYCSERLCEEDMHSFDAKINNENLTKCLQTLREFYADLEKKQKVFCENEAEFRAYTVLMNLNEGDILREVQQLRPSIRSSEPIKFALQAYFALNNNNYIRFFRLVKEASFGNACIMHRYFTQMRNRALTLMMKGFSMGSKSAQVPFKDLVRMLGFEDEQEVSQFCQHYGFRVSESEVMLDRADYIEPETAWSPRRSINIIESKLLVTVGEFMNGGTFSDTRLMEPSSCFDVNGVFHSIVELPSKGVDPLAGARQQEVKVKQEPQGQPVERAATPVDLTPEPPLSLLKRVPPEFIKDCAKMLFWEVIDELVKGISEDIVGEVSRKLEYVDDIWDGLVKNAVVQEEVQSLCEEVMSEAQYEHQEILRQENEERKQRVAVLLTDDLLYDVLCQEIQSTASDEMVEVKAQLKRECVERVTATITETVVGEVVIDLMREMSEDVFETDVRQRLKQLAEFEEIIKLSRAGKFWQIWKKEYKAVTKLKRAMEGFPSAPNMEDYSEQVRSLVTVDDTRVTNGQFYVNKRAKLTVRSAVEINRNRRNADSQVLVHTLYQRLLQHTAWLPLDLVGVVGKQLLRKYKYTSATKGVSKVFWKLLLCLPDIDPNAGSTLDNIASKHLCKWIISKCSKGTPPSDQHSVKGSVLSLYRRNVAETGKAPVSLAVCVRSVFGSLETEDILAAEEDGLLLGTSAMILVLPALRENADPKTYWAQQSERLQSILKVKPQQDCMPLVIFLPMSTNHNTCNKSIQKWLDLDDHPAVEIIRLKLNSSLPDGIDVVDPQVSEKLCESLQWCAENCNPVPVLEVRYLRDFVESALLRFYYKPVQYNLRKRRELGYLDQDPNTLLELYNSIVGHLGEVVTHDDLYVVCWPVMEFTSAAESGLPAAHWNKGDHLEYVYRLLHSLALPEFSPLDPDSDRCVDVERDVWAYVAMVTGGEYGGARTKLYSRLKSLLHTVKADFEDTCYLLVGEGSCEPTYLNVPWSNVLAMCIDYRLDTLDYMDPDCVKAEELKVVYARDTLDDFMPPTVWKHAEPEDLIKCTPSLDQTISCAVNEVREKKASTRVPIEVAVVDNFVSKEKNETKSSAHSLLSSIKSESRESDHFHKYLQSVLNNGEKIDDDLSDSEQSFSSQMNRNDFSMGANQYEGKFNATRFFDRSQNDLSAIFDTSNIEFKELQTSKRRKSDFDEKELSTLYGKKRKERLSEVFNNDPVMMYLKEPTLHEDLASLQENVRAERRNSDMFEKKLKQILQQN